jgi:hypothetical protein
MNHGPFGLSPQVLSIGFLVVFLGGGTLLSLLLSRKKRAVVMPAPSPHQPYVDLVGLWYFKSAARLLGVICGVVLGISLVAGIATMQLSLPIVAVLIAPVVLVIVLAVVRPLFAVQHCSVDQNLAITFIRGGREIPLDLNHYRYVRMHVSAPRYGRTIPSMLVFSRDTKPGYGTLLSSMLFPRVDEGRIVLLYSNWRTAEDDALIPVPLLDDFFRDACGRAGHEPRFRKMIFEYGPQPWEVTPY